MIEFLLIILLIFMPLAFGVVHAWSEEVVIAVVGSMVVCYLLKILFKNLEIFEIVVVTLSQQRRDKHFFCF